MSPQLEGVSIAIVRGWGVDSQTVVYHLLQFVGWPACVGAEGEVGPVTLEVEEDVMVSEVVVVGVWST